MENATCSALNASSFLTELLLVLPFHFCIYFRQWWHHPPGCRPLPLTTGPHPRPRAPLRPLPLPLPSKPLRHQVLFLRPLKCLSPSPSLPLRLLLLGLPFVAPAVELHQLFLPLSHPLLTLIPHAGRSYLLHCQVPHATPLMTTSPATWWAKLTWTPAQCEHLEI